MNQFQRNNINSSNQNNIRFYKDRILDKQNKESGKGIKRNLIKILKKHKPKLNYYYYNNLMLANALVDLIIQIFNYLKIVFIYYYHIFTFK